MSYSGNSSVRRDFFNKPLIFVFGVALRLLIDIFSIYYAFPVYEYAGLEVNLEMPSMVLSWMYFLVLLLFIVFGEKEAIYNGLLLFFIFTPISSYFFVSSGDLMLLSVVFLMHFLIYLMSKYSLGLRYFYNGEQVFGCFAVASIAILSLFFLRSGAWTYLSFDLSSIASIRSELRSVYTGFFAYLLPWCFKIIFPTLLAMAVFRKKYLMVLVISIVMLFLFFVTFRKEVFVYLLLALFVGAAGNKHRNAILLYIVSSLVSVLVVFWVLCFTWGSHLYFSALLQRGFIAIGQNLEEYHAFFQENPYLWFSHSILKGFTENYYDRPIPEIIGHGRWGEGVEGFSNAGVWGSGFMQAGYLGVVFYALIVGLVVSLITSMQRKTTRMYRDVGVTTAALCGLLQLVNVDLASALLTHGLGVSLIVVWFLSGTRDGDKVSSSRLHRAIQ